MPKTKIICTLGPASSDEKTLGKMILAGMDVARLNFSHGSLDAHSANIRSIRKLNKKLRSNIKIMGDLEGHRIRIGDLAGSRPIELKKRQTIWLTQERVAGEGAIIPFDYPNSLDVIKTGRYIYIDDGNIALKVTGRKRRCLKTKVEIEGILKEHKGVNIPEAKLEFRGIGKKDKADIRFCVKNKVDYIAQSFVRTKGDIKEVKDLIGAHRKAPEVVAKIETREGIKNIDEIIVLSDGIMIARGDMGISVPIYKIPVIQKIIIKKCNLAGKFVITATQMLESMTENHIPTRAEVTDVANAIIDGTDYVMLSAESAIGRYPVETVSIMAKIIQYAEDYLKGEARI